MPEGPCRLGALEQFQIVLPDYYIKVLSAKLGFQVIFGRGEKRADQRYLLLLKHDDHYYGLKSLPAIPGRSYYCHVCDKGYNGGFSASSLRGLQTKTLSRVPGYSPGRWQTPSTDASPLSGLWALLLWATLLREPSGVFTQRARSRYPGTMPSAPIPKIARSVTKPSIGGKFDANAYVCKTCKDVVEVATH